MNIDITEQKVKSSNELSKLKLGSITALGWLKEQLGREAKGIGGNLNLLEPNLIDEPYRSRKHEKKMDKSYRAGYCAEMSAGYWLGLIQLAFTLNDYDLKKKAKQWVCDLLSIQEESGYIGCYKKTDNRNEDYNAWGTNMAIQALLSYYEATKDEKILEACHKGLLWFVKKWADNKTEYAGVTLIESMIIVYLYTGDKRLLNWSNDYICWLDKNPVWPINIDSFVNERLEYNSMHAVLAGACSKIPAILYCATGEKKYLDASKKVINKLIKKCLQRTGAPSSNFEYLSPVGSIYETEYCNFTFFASTFSWMAMITGNSRYGDFLEKIIFNGAQGSRKKDEKAIAYMSSPNQLFATSESSVFGPLADMEVYAPVYKVPCCSASYVRIIPEYVRSMCMKDRKGNLFFPCYGPCKIVTNTPEGKKIEIEEITEYPFKEEIKLKIRISEDNKISFTINLRIPEWCNHAIIRINGKKIYKNITKGKYFSIKRLWKDTDTISIMFKMEVKIIKVDDSGFCNKKPVAIEYGPLLFSLPIIEEWSEIEGEPITKLPEGWSWYEVRPKIEPVKEGGKSWEPGWDICKRYELFTWNYALILSKLNIDSDVEIIKEESDKYPWQNSPIKIRIPALKYKYAYPPYPIKTPPVYENLYKTNGQIEKIELIPYGCTALRISYFPTLEEKG